MDAQTEMAVAKKNVAHVKIDLLPSVPEDVNEIKQIKEDNYLEISEICAKYLYEFNMGLPSDLSEKQKLIKDKI
jgi:hypothetical protein